MKIFISYARKDKTLAEALIACLKQAKHEIWYDRNLKPGQSLSSVIDSEIEKAERVVVLFSEAALKSRWVLAEAAAAFEASKLIPIKN